MSGISSILNIAKQALLAHQVSIEVAGNNVANVDTPGYTRQALHLTPAQTYPSPAGLIGTGVDADYIQRFYDQFSTERLMDESSNKSSLDAQFEAIRMVEATFNEAPGLALNDLMSQFWDAWQNLADNPELLPARQNVVQQASLLVNQFQTMSTEINRSRNDIGVNLNNGIKSINSYTEQIASLNQQISSAETANYHANDLRDKRDTVLQQLSELVDVTYFETASGAYTVLLPDGHALVETNESWQVSWENDALQWVTYRRGDNNEQIPVKTTIGSGSELGGKVGGWMEIYNQLDTQNPDSFAGKLNSLAYSFIREVNQQVSQGVGLNSFAGELQGTEVANTAAVLTAKVDSTTANETVPAGTFRINNQEIGKIIGGLPVYGLGMAKAANTVQAINDANAGVRASLTTEVAGDPVAVPAVGTYTFQVNGVDVSVDVLAGDTDADFANKVVNAANAAIAAHNVDPATGPDLTIEAVVGDGTNGGDVNSVILRNTNAGDDSHIALSGIATAGIEANLGLKDGSYTADQTHNTGEVTLFSVDPFTVKAGTDDSWLAQYGLAGGTVSANDVANDGAFTFTASDAGEPFALKGYDFADELKTDGGSFQMWIYNADGSLALGQPVTVALDRAYTLDDVADAINVAITNASGESEPYVKATHGPDGKLLLTPKQNYTFAFANDTSNFLQVAGLNTLFTGDNAGSIGINSLVENDVTNLAAGLVGEFGDIFKGDNSNALLVTNIQRDENVTFLGQPDNTLDGFYNSLVGEIGLQSQIIQRDQEFHDLLSNQLNELRDSVSGVSIDEEMANLIKYQHAYAAAAKLITMGDEMLQTLLETV